jgi:hypothetical protein
MIYNLPHGGTTTDVDTYVDAWRSLATPIEVVTGYVLHSFDPGLTFRNPEGRDSFQLSTHVAKKIVDAIPRKNPLPKPAREVQQTEGAMSDQTLWTRFACNRGDWIAMTCNVREEDALRRADLMEIGETASVWVPNEDAARAPELVEEVRRLRAMLQQCLPAVEQAVDDTVEEDYQQCIAWTDLHNEIRALLPETEEE